jgi:hypothetical protein
VGSGSQHAREEKVGRDCGLLVASRGRVHKGIGRSSKHRWVDGDMFGENTTLAAMHLGACPARFADSRGAFHRRVGATTANPSSRPSAARMLTSRRLQAQRFRAPPPAGVLKRFQVAPKPSVAAAAAAKRGRRAVGTIFRVLY